MDVQLATAVIGEPSRALAEASEPEAAITIPLTKGLAACAWGFPCMSPDISTTTVRLARLSKHEAIGVCAASP